MNISTNMHVAAREEVIATSMRDVASELRMIDVVEFIAYIRFEKFGIIDNLVATATELYFAPGSLCFGHGGELEVDWGRDPVIKLDMEFHHPSVQVQFCLNLEGEGGCVELNNITFSEQSREPEENTEMLRIAMLEARRHKPLPSSLLSSNSTIAGQASLLA